MYSAEPVDASGPTVTVVDMTANPLRLVAAVSELYRGGVFTDPRLVTQERAMEWYHGALKARGLPAPLEWVSISLHISGVTRGWTHQAVRQRTATYVQESMRFAVKDDAETAIIMPEFIARLAEDHPLRVEWTTTSRYIAASYGRMVNGGVPAEDARGVLPTNIGTRMHYHTNLRNLIDHAGLRLCSQAQYEWKQVWAQIIRAILAYGPDEERWQQEAIVRMFRPVCYQTGRCEFMGPADRHCDIRDRVEEHHRKGDRPETWTDIHPHEPLSYGAARRP
jgi:flavin-dependent thymidylate synthase